MFELKLSGVVKSLQTWAVMKSLPSAKLFNSRYTASDVDCLLPYFRAFSLDVYEQICTICCMLTSHLR